MLCEIDNKAHEKFTKHEKYGFYFMKKFVNMTFEIFCEVFMENCKL